MSMNLKEKGFTLMEVIISIAILAIISGFILQMFIVSSNANEKARNIDIGTAVASTSIELLKKQTKLNDYAKIEFFSDCSIIEIEQDSSQLEIYKYYDKDWEHIPDTDTTNARFVLYISIVSSLEQSAKTILSFGGADTFPRETGQMCSMEVTIIDLTAASEKQELLNLQAKKYFTLVE